MTMFVKISSLLVCLVLIQSNLNAAASEDPSRQRYPRTPTTKADNLYILNSGGDVYEGSNVDKNCYYSHETDKADESWWTKNGTIIASGSDSAHLVFKNITSKDSGTYICNAKLKGGLTVSKKIEIRVTVPTITPVKVEHFVKVGGNVTLSCLVNRTSFEDFTWRKLNESKNVRRIDNVESKKKYDDTHYSLDLNLVRVSRNDNGIYVCEATIDGREIETRTHLRVLEKPEISGFNVRPIGARNVRLNWTLIDGNSPVTEHDVSFKVDGNKHYVPLETVKVSNCKDCSYDLESKKLENHKSYKFSIATRNSEGGSNIAESNMVNMSVIDEAETPSLEIRVISTDSSRVAGDHETMYAESQVMLNCSIINDIKVAQLWWDRDGKNFTNSAIIEMKTPSQNDTGNYTCLVEAMNGDLSSKSISLTVLTGSATIWKEEEFVRAQLNTSTTLRCDPRVYSLSDLTWVKLLPNRTELLIDNSKSYLTIERVSDNDNGTYECRATLGNTTRSSKTHLTVTSIAELVTTFVKSVGKGKIYLSWTINEHNEPLKNYSIDQEQKGVKKWETLATVMGRGNSSLLLEGLEPGKAYRFRIRASNSLGNISEEFNSLLPVTVLKEDPDFVVPRVTIVEKSGNWITIGWTIPPKNLQEYFGYYHIMVSHGDKKSEIRYCPAEIVSIYNFTNIENPEADDYRFKVRACNNYANQCCGWSASSMSSTPSSEISVVATSILFSLYFLSR